MRLVRPRKEGSFYESFSDLIFTTMAIFVLLMMIMMAQVRPNAVPREEAEAVKRELAEARQALKQSESQRDSKAKFAGGTGQTRIYIAHASHRGAPSVVFFPSTIALKMDIDAGARKVGGFDPLMDICELAVSEDGFSVLSAREFVELGGGLSRSVVSGALSAGEGTLEMGVLLMASERGELRGLSGGEVRRRVFGEITKINKETFGSLGPSWREYYNQASKFVHANDHKSGRGFHSWMSETITPLRMATADEPKGVGRIRFTAFAAGRVRVGRTELTAGQFRGLLRAVVPGAGFHIEHVDDAGNETAAPEWVIRDVLQPVGFSVRI